MNGIGLGGFGVPPQQADYVATDAQSTGNFLVLLVEGAEDAGLEELQRATGAEFVNTADTSIGALEAVELQEAGAVVFDKLGVVLVRAEPQQIRELRVATAEDQPILVVEPERVVSVLTPQDPSRTVALPSTATPASIDYLRGYQDAVVNLVGSLSSSATAVSTPGLTGLAAFDESEATWGLQVTGVTSACSGGQGQRAAVLDTGLDLTHPDFTGRGITSQSFIAGEAVQDGHGHGTHCIGTAMGPLHPQVLPRYGIAYGADIFAGKVLNNQGRGADGGILAGINWAVTNGCRVVSMSLGAPTAPGQSFSRVFEAAAQRALAAGTLIVAAAGNESQRSMGIIRPVGHPANCPSIMAVAALDEQLQVANFSTRGINPTGGQIDIAAPGVRVYSSWPMPTRNRTISGTSMATPHVAGIAILLAEASPGSSAVDLWSQLTRTARRLPLPSVDVGTGLVQAP